MEVLDVLNRCRLEGNVLYLPDVQMDRKLYLDVAKKIELIGGKWNRKEKGFLFKEDPAELFESIKNGDNRNLKKEFQFFATPEKLCEYIPEGTETILEPSAGQGAINKYNPNIKVSYCELMELNKNQDIEHFYKRLKHAKKRVISIMSKHWEHSSFKKETEFRDFIYSSIAKVIEIEAGAFKESGTMISGCIVIFDKENKV